MTHEQTQAERAREVISHLLEGGEPNGTSPDMAGPWADALAALHRAHEDGGTEAVKRVFDALAREDPSLANLICGDGADTLPKPHPVATASVLEALKHGETGDAEVLEAMRQNQIAFDHSEGAWYLWGGHHWTLDRTDTVYRLVSCDVAARYLEAGAQVLRERGDRDLSDALTKRARDLGNRRRVDNVLHLAARQPGLALAGDEWDTDPWLLGVANGVLDLRTGTLRPGRPLDYIRSVAPTEWHGLDAPAPLWERFLGEVFAGDDDLIASVQRLLGYGCTGLTYEHRLPILWGPGRNGKGTLLEAVGDVLGPDLAIPTQAEALMDVGGRGGGPQPFVYQLRGKRLVWASETNEGRRLNAGLVKLLTGGDTRNVRTLHSRPVRYKPSDLILLLTNAKPRIDAEDQALWDRVLLIPFTERFVDDPGPGEHKRDPAMREKLAEEGPEILAWLVRGCLAWQRDGLAPPPTVKAATEGYRREEDTVAQFLEECCVTGDGCEARAAEMYQAYEHWSTDNGLRPMSGRAFGERLNRRFDRKRTGQGRVYVGVGLLEGLETG